MKLVLGVGAETVASWARKVEDRKMGREGNWGGGGS